LAEVYAAHFDYVWRILARLGVRSAELEDAVQEVFIVVHRRLGSFDTRRPIRPWLGGIAHRVALAERRRARHRREQLCDAPAQAEPAPASSPEASLIARQKRERVHAALQSLDLDRRTVFVMYEMEGISGAEIAEALGIPLNTVYSRLRIARERFRQTAERLRRKEGAA
jgi:RNA polymerase sigma-70 factor (ECF subfamily)